MNTTASDPNKVFDYRALRLLMGIIAISLPIVVSLRSSLPLSSISASYYTESRDFFVGLLFFVAAFLFAYNGHTTTESVASKVACLAAVMVAIFPTDPDCKGCPPNSTSFIHYISAAVMFGILAYFCLFPFRVNTKGQTGKKKRRDVIYVTCGWIIIACLLTLAVTKLTLSDDAITALQITYWAEFFALWAFGIAWLVAGKSIGLLVDDNEKFHPFADQGIRHQ